MTRSALRSPRSVAFVAYFAASFCSFIMRPSSHSDTGLVLVCAFRRFDSAAAFARCWAGRLGVSVAVRRLGPQFTVSVPVWHPSSKLPAGFNRRWAVSGGLSGLCGVLGAAGLVSLRGFGA